jgi:SulP family sulfate permease
MIKGLHLIIEPDPNLAIQALGPVSMSVILGTAGLVLTFLLLENKKLPAALVLIVIGIVLGIFIGKPINAAAFNWSIHLPNPLPYGWPSVDDFIWVIPVLVLPQIPMTIGNAIISNTDITHEYFSDRAKRVTYRSVANSQGLADIVSFFFGGIPMCHGAGGLAAHYRFGARTAGSNAIIGGIFVLLALVFGENIVAVLRLLPFSLLGVLLVFAGLQLALMIQDLRDRKDLFVALLMLGIALATNLGVAFVAGIIAAYAFKSDRLSV